MNHELPWDPEIDTPATVAVIGAGPLGIEAALYARFLGYYVVLFDESKVASNLLRWGHVRMVTPFRSNCTSLGLAALESHGQLGDLPSADDFLTGREYVERYVVPLARTDLVYECVNVFSKVVSVSRTLSRPHQVTSIQARADEEFRLVINSKQRGWFIERADIVLDCSGASSKCAIGPGGGLAIGEMEFASDIVREMPDLSGTDRAKYTAKHTLLYGSGYEAALTAIALAKLIGEQPKTKVTWVVNHEPSKQSSSEPSAQHDPFPHRAKVLLAAQQLKSQPPDGLAVLFAWGVERLERNESGTWQARLLVSEEDTLDVNCDHFVALSGNIPSNEFGEALAIDATNRFPINFDSQSKILQFSGESLNLQREPQESNWSTCITSEPHYYLIGRRSYRQDDGFMIHQGYSQIRHIFSLIAGRKDLDLYHSVRPSGVAL